MTKTERWIARDEALARLRIKTQTLYAYVSRGRITARPDPANPRRSLYAVEDVQRLISGEAPAPLAEILPFEGPPLRGEALVQSSLTVIAGGNLFYRGRDAVDLAETSTAEETAALLWDLPQAQMFAGIAPRLTSAGGVTARMRLFSALGRRAEEDAPATGRSLDALKAEAVAVLTEVIDAIAGPGPRLYFHQRLGRGWKVVERDNPLIRRALVLAADETVDPAVVATRAAAGGGASPAAAAFAGLATFSASPLYAAVTRASVFVQEARREPVAAIARRIARDGVLPGFTDDTWPSADPRAESLLMAADLPADLSAVLQQGEATTGNPPGFDLALALLARRLDLPRDGACDLLLVGRLIGLLGHALDQAGDGSPIAARLRYVGARPGAG